MTTEAVKQNELLKNGEQLFMLEFFLNEIKPDRNNKLTDVLGNEPFFILISFMNFPTFFLREDILDRNVCYKDVVTKWIDGKRNIYYINQHIENSLKGNYQNNLDFQEIKEEDDYLYLTYGGASRTSCLFPAIPSKLIQQFKNGKMKFQIFREKNKQTGKTSELPDQLGATESVFDEKFLDLAMLCECGRCKIPAVAESQKTINITDGNKGKLEILITVKLTAFGVTDYYRID